MADQDLSQIANVVTTLTEDALLYAGDDMGGTPADAVIAVADLRVLMTEQIVTREVPTGDIDGNNDTFTLAHTPVSGSEMVFLQGALLAAGGADYSITGDTITMTAPPSLNDVLVVSYRY